MLLRLAQMVGQLCTTAFKLIAPTTQVKTRINRELAIL
jgi:hypothetical protein